MRKVVIVGGVRTPFVKSMTAYSGLSNQELVVGALKALVENYNLKGKILGDVALGAVMKNAEDWNLSREAVLKSGLHPHTPGYDVQRACGTGLETISQIALKIAAGQIEVGIGGGVDTNSDIQATLPHRFTWTLLKMQQAKSWTQKLGAAAQMKFKDLKPQFPAVMEPQTGLSMGQHTELMVKEWKVTRDEQDQLALESHQKAAQAYQENFYSKLVTPFNGVLKDPLVRGDTSLEKLKKLKPAFDKSESGTLTAGNSTPLTDGASVVLLASEEYAKANDLPILATFVDFQSAAVDFVHGEGLLIAPTLAVSQMLERNKLQLQDFDYYEIHEAFAGQVLVTLKAWESAEYCRKVLGRASPLGAIDRQKLNVRGGSLALGHPFAATGGRIVASLAHILSEKPKQRGLVSICTAGGMGVCAILESH